MNNTAAETTRVDSALNGKTLNVPTPWGWPGHNERVSDSNHTTLNGQEVRGVSESLQRLVDHLISEKQTVEDQEYLLKKEASLRALLEDRYGRPRLVPDAEPENLNVPPSRDPGESFKLEALRDMKTPWGW